jgi:RimJ/RimL family protein N-acetyltransferase
MSASQDYLLTARFRLRRFERADLHELVRMDAEPEVMRYINGGVPVTADDWQEKIFPVIEGYYERYAGELGNWIAESRESGVFSGWYHLRPAKQDLDNRKVLELGFRLPTHVWGQGAATEVSLGLIDKAFRELGAEEIFARAHAENRGSQRVLEKCGLSLVERSVEESFPGPNKTLFRYTLPKSHWLDVT